MSKHTRKHGWRVYVASCVIDPVKGEDDLRAEGKLAADITAIYHSARVVNAIIDSHHRELFSRTTC